MLNIDNNILQPLSKYVGEIYVNEVLYSKESLPKINELEGEVVIKLIPNVKTELPNKQEAQTQRTSNQSAATSPINNGVQVDGQVYEITVKKWMTVNDDPTFTYHSKWNNNKPMPMKTMQGVIIGETPGMYKMSLKAAPQMTSTCMKCGKELTNPVSMLYGIGPECGSSLGLDYSKLGVEEAKKQLEEIYKNVEKITWEGWVAKSALLRFEKIN